MKKIKYKQNQKINNLVFVKEIEPYISPSGEKKRKALFRCYCGNEFEAHIADVKSNKTTSCGCYKIQKATTHGLIKHPIYKVWADMKTRCYNPKHKHFHRYGGRGIKVCDDWENDFKKFYDFCTQNGYKKGLEIDRINNDGNYEPKNCRFVTHIKNVRNRSTTKLNWETVQEIRNAKLLNPELTQEEFAVAYGVGKTTIHNILNNERWRI
jgi:predicted DNA-binding protein (UPF0251 family)